MKHSGQEQVNFEQVSNKVSISTYDKFTEDKRKRRIPKYTTYDNLIRYAETYQRSHRLEEYLTHKLQQLGLNAHCLPARADGNTKAKQADIIITTADGQKLALEVKEARYNGCTLGLPVGDGTAGYSRLPQRLFVDSCSAWDSKESACERRGEVLLGAVILSPIGKLSDEEFTVLGAVYCPNNLSEHWLIRETQNRGRYYEAYVCKRQQMRTLEDLVKEVNEW